ncbi:amino acid ABC transporter ATP-binding protein [[Clostridium] innocuum]|uniref:amino acid ABC transporter ATP-binding protein n=1 Tax=Clostridium innocuum TaxID=1522 RepID=UPI0006C6C51E|nr:amino acid ABC transporter ATP-binding protein [[Clostridium] innocuum]CUQ90884.1 ABC transporter [[Clostridium] innocuum]
MIRVEHLYKNYGDSVKVLFDVNFTFEDGKTYAIIGSSGGGKSTFIRCLNMLEVPTSGDIFYNETKINDPKTDLARVREKIGMVFQNFNLFDHMKAIDNVTYALRKVKKMNAEEARAKGLSLLEKVGLRHRADAYPHQLSGGEKQRCAIARALAMEPDVLLFDEPTSALDPEMTGEVLKVLKDLNHTGITMIVVTHEMNFAKKVADYVIYMDKGNIEECSKAAEFFEKPKTARAKEFLSKMI